LFHDRAFHRRHLGKRLVLREKSDMLAAYPRLQMLDRRVRIGVRMPMFWRDACIVRPL
jgi:hypothetical protein